MVVVACSPAPSPAPVLAPLVVPVATEQDAGSAPVARAGDKPAEPASDGKDSPGEQLLREWSRKSQCSDYDYFPEGGIQNFWCHRPARLSVAAVRELAGVDIFASGPHTKDTLTLDSTDKFGHYNPAFVRWLVTDAAPSARGSAVQVATQPAYDAALKPLAHIFWKTYGKVIGEKECFAREKTAYAALIASHRLPKNYYERWFWFMNPYFCGRGLKAADTFYFDNAFDAGVDGNVTKTVVGFWLRRSMDGTIDAFADGLKKLMASYDPELLTTTYVAADPAALTRALDAGVKGASTCKDPSSKRKPDVDIVAFPDGHVTALVKSPPGTTQVACIEAAFNAQKVPPFSGEKLHFSRSVSVK